MKISNLISTVVFLGVAGVSFVAQAHGQRRERFHQAVLACQNSELNTAKVVFPQPTPGQRPEFSADQKALFQACVQAGIIPRPRWHHHEQEGQAATGAAQEARQPSSN